MCPAPQRFPSPDGGPALVSYLKPTVSGGADRVVTRCLPASGSAFPLGVTSVTCTAVDAEQRSASCSFNVTVTVPRLKASRFMAFGDSITEGSDGDCPGSLIGDPLTWALQDVQFLKMNLHAAATAYPGVLQGLLTNRYRSQTITVVNEGNGGERATAPATQTRLAAELTSHSPDVLLLQEGVNDVHRGQSAANIANALRNMIRTAKGRGIGVFLGTLLPERVGGCRAGAPERIVPVNVQLRAVAASEGAVLVDLYQAFLGQEGTLLDEDGLHPSIAGYAKMADTFFESIRVELEEP
jgi:lysophospholipase L1-like esterase